MKFWKKYAEQSTITPLSFSGSILLLSLALLMSTVMMACTNQGDAADPAPTPTLTEEVEAQTSPDNTPESADEEQSTTEQAIAQTEGQSQASIETEARLTDINTSIERGFSERDDFVGTFVGRWLVENQPARQVLLALRHDDTAQMSIQNINDPGQATDESGTWVFESAGVAAIALETSGHLTLRFDEGLMLRGGAFGEEGLAMLLYNPE